MRKFHLSVLPVLLLLTACGSGKGNREPQPMPQPVEPPLTIEPPATRYLGFESAPVRPIAQQGNRVFVVNTSNNSVSIFTIQDNGSLSYQQEIPVGLEPVALAFASANELWVVNHISDSVSIVDVSVPVPVVTKTLLVGDEPQDIVFARGKAFISTAHRGQQLLHHSLRGVEGAGDPQLHTPSVGRADVWVFDPLNLGNGLGGVPLKIVSLFWR